MSKEYKIGESVTMLFHGFGLISEEQCEVVAVEENRITLDNEHSFDTTTGVCLDDVTAFGCKRTLKLE